MRMRGSAPDAPCQSPPTETRRRSNRVAIVPIFCDLAWRMTGKSAEAESNSFFSELLAGLVAALRG